MFAPFMFRCSFNNVSNIFSDKFRKIKRPAVVGEFCVVYVLTPIDCCQIYSPPEGLILSNVITPTVRFIVFAFSVFGF